MSRRFAAVTWSLRRLLPARPCHAALVLLTMSLLVAFNAAIACLYLAPSWLLGSSLLRAKVELHTAVLGAFAPRAELGRRMEGLRCLVGLSASRELCAGTDIPGPHATLEQQQVLLPWLLEDIGAMQKRWSGRGVVLTAGDGQADAAVALIRALAEVHHSTLPIEVFYRGDEDLSLQAQQRLEQLPNVRRVTNLQRAMRAAEWHAIGARSKPFAALFSSFSEVLLLDADAVLLMPPPAFFEALDYQRTGALFFRGRCHGLATGAMAAGHTLRTAVPPHEAPASPLLHLLETLSPLAGARQKGRPDAAPALAASMRLPLDAAAPGTAAAWASAALCSSVIDAGLLVLDKRKATPALLGAAMLNDLHSRAVFRVDAPRGDAEAWWLSPHALGVPYAFEAGLPAAVGVRRASTVCSPTVAHVLHTLGGEPAWWEGGLSVGASALGAAADFTSWAVPAVSVPSTSTAAGTVPDADATVAVSDTSGTSATAVTPAGWASPLCVRTGGRGGVDADFTSHVAEKIAKLARIYTEESSQRR